jgi:hypothetical protein
MADIGIKLDADRLVLTKNRDFRWVFENLDEHRRSTPFPDGDLFLELDTGEPHNAVHDISISGANDGTYTLTVSNSRSGVGGVSATTPDIEWDAPTVSPQDATADVKKAVETVAGDGNVLVHPAKLYPVWMIELTINGPLNEIQHIQFTGNPTGGQFKLGFGFALTPAIDYGADPSAVKSALQQIPSIGTGNVKVTSDGAKGYVVEFIGALAGKDQQQIMGFPIGIFLDFGLTGGFFPNIKVTTLVNGIGTVSQKYIDMLNKYIEQFFNSFDELLGVDITLTLYENHNMMFKVKALNGWDEVDIFSFLMQVTNDSIAAFLNQVSSIFGIVNMLHVNFYWDRHYNLEFINDWGNTPVSVSGDGSGLSGIDNDQQVVDTVINPGKSRFEQWQFDIVDSLATVKVESESVNKILPRTIWQLVFLPEGEPRGGDPVALGQVLLQPRGE